MAMRKGMNERMEREGTLLTIAQAKIVAREYGCSLRRDSGEWRVCLYGFGEETACYESRLIDALDTARVQYAWRLAMSPEECVRRHVPWLGSNVPKDK